MANGHPWERAKSFDHSAVVGEMMPIEQLHFDTFNFQLKKNGELYQNGKTSEMIFNFDEIIVEVSKYFTLQQGDLIFTGSPAGVSRVDIGDTLELLQENKSLYTINIK
jgi:2-keto-4-pentenoate hydratase/2-oxohepta-3-ene-1,7-dioic acid hydratase in catechol pathway